jgi:lipopolysaccharide/colanic/teichoic acid biosynthesis glycosyltransferase
VDIILSFIGILVTLPFQVIISCILFLELRENPFFIQERAVAYGTRHFKLYKFRTIRSRHSNSILCDYNSNNFLVKQIPFKLSPFAKMLRKTGLDELPQIYNVLVGQMSLIGPRPLMLEDLNTIKTKYYDQHLIRTNLISKPGITGMWQVSGVRALGVENLLGLDLFYEENKSFKLDLRILYSTLYLAFFSKISDGVISRKNSIDEIYSVSHFEYLADHGKYLKHNRSLVKSYSLKMPEGWWYASDTYASSSSTKTKQPEKPDKALPLKKIFTN